MSPAESGRKQPSSEKAGKPDARTDKTESLESAQSESKEYPVSPEWIARQKTEDLVSLMVEIALELKARAGKETERVPREAAPTFRPASPAEVKEFTRLPAASKKVPAASAATRTWRLLLISSRRDHDLLGLEIYDEIVIGRAVPKGVKPDLDLTEYDAEALGVSRQHSILRPTEKSLQLLDLGSTNGTFRNVTRVKLGAPQEIRDGDSISLGELHFKVKIVSQPGKKKSVGQPDKKGEKSDDPGKPKQ